MVAEVLAVIRSLAEEGMTMVVVTHELGFARAVASRVLFLDDGTILDQGTPEEALDHPTSERCRRFVRHLRSLDLTIEGPDPDYGDLEARVERFAAEAALSADQRRRLTLAFEELVFQSALPQLTRPHTGFPLQVSAEHADGGRAESDDGGGTLTLRIRWHDIDVDLLTAGDDLTRRILAGFEMTSAPGGTDTGDGSTRELTLVL